MSGTAWKVSSLAGTVFVTSCSNSTVAVMLAKASASSVPCSTLLGTPLSVIFKGCLSSAEVKPPIGSMVEPRKLMNEPSGARKQRMVVFDASVFRFTSGVFCV